jgi:catechol 2,3-dioxygenase-like lactoylglutathione lyase family enzyme
MEAYIRNIVFGCPDPRALSSFYADLLGMRILREDEDWIVIAKDENSFPRLAFGDGPADYRPPRWPDPEHPQQLHLDIPVYNLEAAEELVLRLGATRLQDQGAYRSYADPAGHPFCLYRDAAEGNQSGRPLSGRIGRVVFDCFSPRALAAFYEALLGMRTRREDSQNWVLIARDAGSLPMLAFQHAQCRAPRWPDPAYPQQLHLDLHFDDGKAAQALALRLGAIRLPDMGGSCPVYADPAAHPFCLCSPGQ